MVISHRPWRVKASAGEVCWCRHSGDVDQDFASSRTRGLTNRGARMELPLPLFGLPLKATVCEIEKIPVLDAKVGDKGAIGVRAAIGLDEKHVLAAAEDPGKAAARSQPQIT